LQCYWVYCRALEASAQILARYVGSVAVGGRVGFVCYSAKQPVGYTRWEGTARKDNPRYHKYTNYRGNNFELSHTIILNSNFSNYIITYLCSFCKKYLDFFYIMQK